MDALLVRIAERITSGADPLLSPSEALELARLPESATLDILSVAGLARAARKPAAAFTCGIINAKSGRCPENCAFCAQSAHHQTDSPVYPLYDTDTLLRRAEELCSPTPSIHRLRRGLPGYLILFAPHAFVPQCQFQSSKPPSPLMFLLISTHFTATLGIPLTSTSLKNSSFKCRSGVEPLNFTSDLPSRLHSLYTQ